MLNARPIPSQFQILPRNLQVDITLHVKEALKSDSDKLRRALSRIMTCRIAERQYSETVYMPHKMKLESQIQQQLCVPTLLLDSIFGCSFEKFNHRNELVSYIKKSEELPYFLCGFMGEVD